MNIKLKKFDLLCEELLQEKRANIFTKIFTNQRYLQDDFRQVWEGSGFKKLLAALDTALGKNSASKLVIKDLPELDVKKMLDLKSQQYDDLPAGTVEGGNIGLRLTYDILPEYKYPLLKILINRDENTNNDLSKFGMFTDYFNELVTTAEEGLQNKVFKGIKNINTDIKLQIIAVPTAKENSDYTENKKHTHLSQASFKCTIFLWFDAQNFKKELQFNLKNGLEQRSSTQLNKDNNSEELNIDSLQKQKRDIEAININNSKIKLGDETISISGENDGTFTKLYKGLKDYNLNVDLAKLAGNALGINKIFGIGGKDQAAEKPDKVRVNQHFWHSFFNIADMNNPYVNVLSKVTLQSWLYKDNYNKSIVDIDNKRTTNFAIQQRKPFSEALLKLGKNSPGVLTGDLSNSKIWRTDEYVGRSIWPENADPAQMTEYLNPDNDNGNTSKKITCRWQYFLDKTHALYAEYRVAIELTDFYNILNLYIDLLTAFKNNIIHLEQDNNITITDISNVIKIIKNQPKYLLPNIQVNQNQQNTYKKVQSVLTGLRESQMITFLKSPGDNTNVISQHGLDNHIKKYNVLLNIFKNKILQVKQNKVRSVNYNNLKLSTLFSDWWNLYYRPMTTMNKNQKEFDLVSQKNIYTNNNKSPNNNIPTNVKHGFAAFRDVDTTAAEYFNNIILNKADPFILNGQSLNNFFNKYLEKVQIELDINTLKQYFQELAKFNNTLLNITISSANQKNSVNIEHALMNYLIK